MHSEYLYLKLFYVDFKNNNNGYTYVLWININIHNY